MSASWNDLFFDSPFHPTKSPASTPPPFASGSTGGADHGAYGHMSSVEKDFCSNFSCCGLSLADLHELLDHFEEAHVIVLGRDGRPVYPSLHPEDPSSPAHEPTRPADCEPAAHVLAPCASIVFSYPQPDPPVPASPAHADPRTTFDALLRLSPAHTYRDVLARGGADPDAASPPDSLRPSPAPSEPVCLPPALLSVCPPPATHAAPAGSQKSLKGKDGAERQRTPKIPVGKGRVQVRGAAERRERHAPAPARRREREKAYKCPRRGCSKSYLNPNGLKYHLEKGTCTIAAPLAVVPDL
ncbi:hypothetical protein AcV7_006250 [Taiwanofungus camphoratus]|nr:hypothetical protein AcV7_006250 [Antrodia cinnamomea]